MVAVFDLDDTLVVSQAKVGVVFSDGRTARLSPSEYANASFDEGSVFDFSEFDDRSILRAGRVVWEVAGLMQSLSDAGCQLAVVTARSNADMVHDFVGSFAPVRMDMVYAVSAPGGYGPIEDRKARAFLDMRRKGCREFMFFDDCAVNLRAAGALCAGISAPFRGFLVKPGSPFRINRFNGWPPAEDSV